MDFKFFYKEIQEEIISARRYFHQNPELGFCEYKTADKICEILDKYNINYKRNIAKTGIVAQVGTDTEKVLLIRADMDALPIEEKTGLDFSSINKGLMHACGHDIHISVCLAAAIILKKNESKLKGTVKFVFQPAEETTGGAAPMISEGIMSNPKVTAAIGAHVSAEIPCGYFQVKSGALMASPDDFEVVFKGKSTHGAQPENGISPIIPACEFTLELEKLKESLCKGTPNVLSVCSVISNGGVNTIPDNATVLGTFRSFDEKHRKLAETEIDNLASQISLKHNNKYKFKYNYLYPPVINNELMTSKLFSVVKDTFDEKNISIMDKPLMTGEDFAYFANEVPSVFFWYGGMDKNPCALHSSDFVVNEEAIEKCANIFVNFALDYLG